MYSPFNPSSRRGFIEQELVHEYLSFPDESDEAYSAVINWLSGLEGMAGFDGARNVDLDAYDILNTGRQFSIFLPGHTMKVYQTLLHLEYDSMNKRATSILEQPHILLVDDGCGGGTASVALISLIANYQKYRVASKLPIFPVTISCVGIDPNSNALRIYGRFLGECADKIKHLLIDVKSITILPGTLPENTAPIIGLLVDQKRTHCVVLTISNVIQPLTREHEEESRIRAIFDKIGMGNLLPDRWGKDIGAREITTLRSILDTNIADQVVVLLVGAHSIRDGKPKQSWRDEMMTFQSALCSKLSKQHHVNIDLVRARSLKMVNPNDCFWRKHPNFGYKVSPEIEYDSGFAIIYNQNYKQDSVWQAILERENLLLAWARVRNDLSFGMLEDTIELRLFEANIEERLDKLSSEVRSYQWDVLSIPEMLNYRVPKGVEKTPRPMNLCRLEDQILATAILQVKGQEYSTAHHPRSYAYKLFAKPKGERLYEGWFEQYQLKFLADARKVADQYPSYRVIRTDLSSYYTDIVQSELFQQFEHQMKLYKSRGSDLAEKLIGRDCGIEKDGCGIPQGHIISGAMANLYLAEIDLLFGPGNCWGIEYFRFVDDMIFMFPPDVEAEFVLELLDEKLSPLRLTRSMDKTSLMNTQEFLQMTAPDSLLEELSKEHNFLLSDLYKLGRDYIRIALDDWWSFVECYQKLLAGIGVYISVPRLSRKLQKNYGWWRRTFNWWRKLRLPKVGQLEDLKDLRKWRSEFNRYNGGSTDGWIQRREKLVRKLSNLLRDSASLLNSETEVERARSNTRVKFALYRLGQLGFGEEADTVVDLLVEQPWTLNARRVCQDLALQGWGELLIDAFNRIHHHDSEEWAYVRGAILKAFSNLPSISRIAIVLLQDIALHGKTILERTMASESLFLLQRPEALQKNELVNAIEQIEDNYLSKNYVLLNAITPGDGETSNAYLSQGRILNEALEYVRAAPKLDELYRYEPDILREEFYEGDYPDDSDEFEVFPY